VTVSNALVFYTTELFTAVKCLLFRPQKDILGAKIEAINLATGLF